MAPEGGVYNVTASSDVIYVCSDTKSPSFKNEIIWGCGVCKGAVLHMDSSDTTYNTKTVSSNVVSESSLLRQ